MALVFFVHKPVLSCATVSLPAAQIGVPYSYTLQPQSGTPFVGNVAIFAQPTNVAGISGNFYVTALDGRGPPTKWVENFWQKNVWSGDGSLVTSSQNFSALTGFDPTNRATGQLAFRDQAGSSCVQMQGDTVGAYINTDDVDTAVYDKMMITPSYDFSVPPIPFPFLSAPAMSVAMQLQVPTAVVDHGQVPPVYVNLDLLFTDPNGVNLSFTAKIFRMGSGGTQVTSIGYDGPSNSYMMNYALNDAAFCTLAPGSATQTGTTWTGFRTFAWTVSNAQFTHALDTIAAAYPQITSRSPSQWALMRVHLNAEIQIQGYSGLALGWSMKGLSINGSRPAYIWSMTPATVNGISLGASGVLSGTPVAARTDTLAITLEDALDTVPVSLALTAGGDLRLTGQSVEVIGGVPKLKITRTLGTGTVGKLITCTPGTITADVGQNLDITLTGQRVTTARGAITSSMAESFALSGLRVTSNRGLITAGGSSGVGGGGGTGVSIATIRNAGYIIATDAPYNCDPTGVADSTAGLQAAIDAGCLNFQPVFLPNQTNDAQGIYKISNTLRFYQFYNENSTSVAETSGHNFLGATNLIGQHPIIQLAANTTKFGSLTASGYAVPMIAIRAFTYTGGGGAPALPAMTFDPYTTSPGSWNGNGTADVWDGSWLNFNLDTNNNSKACGMVINGAQTVYLANIAIDCTNSLSGITAAPGNGSVLMNFSITGGEYGVDLLPQLELAWQADHPTFVGLTCAGQTIACMRPTGSQGCEVCVVGFDFQPSSGATAWSDDSSSNNANYTACFYNGKVTGAGDPASTAFPNSDGRDLYLGDVYITGFTNVTKFAALGARLCAGTWSQVVEYCATSQKNLAGNSPAIHAGTSRTGPWPHYNFIDGVQSQAAEPAATINTSFAAGSIPTDLISRHVVRVPVIDNTIFVDIRDYGATPLSVTGFGSYPTHNYGVYIQWSSRDAAVANSRAAVQQAIDIAAPGTAVLIPVGLWEVGAPGLALNSSTILMGLGRRRSVIATHPSWQPTAQTPVLTTPAVADSSCALANFGIALRRAQSGDTMGANGYPHDWFILFDWQAGGTCFTWGVYGEVQYLAEESSTTLVTPPLKYQYIHGATAGGRFYGLCQGGYMTGIAGNHDARPVLMSGTQQPCYFYSFNIENSKQTNVSCDFNFEATGCSNIRIYGSKREGSGASVKLTNCDNVGFFGSGVFSGHTVGETEIGSGCTNILLHNHQPFGDVVATNLYDFVDDVSGVKIERPKVLSLYKRGSLDDAAMVIASGSGVPTLATTTTTLPDAVVGESYFQQLTATGGVPPYTWNNVSFRPHQGLWAHTVPQGAVQGTPQFEETVTAVWQVNDSLGTAAQTPPITFKTVASGALTIRTTSLPNVPTGGMFGAIMTASGGVPPYVWSIVSQSGTTNTFNMERNGLLTGAPTVAGSHTITITVTDSAGATVGLPSTYTITVDGNAATNLTINLIDNVTNILRIPSGYTNTKYGSSGARFTCAGGTPPYTWSLSSGDLNGLFVGSTGTLTGTLGPRAGTISGTVRVTDSLGKFDTANVIGNVLSADKAARPAYNTGSGFFVSGGKLYDPQGNRFHMRGMNQDVYDANESAAWNTLNPNSCRYTSLQLRTAPATPNMTTYMTNMTSWHLNNKRFAFLQAFKTQPTGTVPVSTDKDAFLAGLQPANDLANVVAWWVNGFGSFAAMNSGMIGLANEFGPPASAHVAPSTAWRNMYKAVGFDANGDPNMDVSSVSVSATATITVSSSAVSNPFANATMVSIFGAAGTINGVVGNVTSVGGSQNAWTVITDIDNSAGQWTSGGSLYGGAVGILRAKGYTCPFFIDSGNFGHFEDNIDTYAAEIVASDPQQNLIFNIHDYNYMTAASCKVKSVTAGATTTLTLRSTAAHHPFEQPPAGSNFCPFYGVVIEGMAGGSWANKNGSYIGPGNNTGGTSPNWTITQVPFNSTGFTGYVADSARVTDWGHPMKAGQRFYNLRSSNVCAIIGEFGATTGVGPSPTYLSTTDVIAGMEAWGCGWLAWASDDAAAYFGLLTDRVHYTSPSSLTAQLGQQIVMHPRMSWFVLATAAPYFL